MGFCVGFLETPAAVAPGCVDKKDNVALIQTLGGELGASRPELDAGWVEHGHQVGTTGQTVSCLRIVNICVVKGAEGAYDRSLLKL